MKNTMFVLLLALGALPFSGCGNKATPPPAQASKPAVETADDSAYDEAPGLDEEGSREW